MMPRWPVLKERDMTPRQFETACARHGFVWLGGGKVCVPLGDGRTVTADLWRSGPSRRQMLAYLLRVRRRAIVAAKPPG